MLVSIKQQTVQPDFFLAIDSGSDDRTVELLNESGAQVHAISRKEFNHGGTRQLAVDMFPAADIVVFLTQDAIPSNDDALEKLVSQFEDESVGAAYGRQLHRPSAGLIEAHARLFNYPVENQVKTIADLPRLGFKTAFISNSFAGYRRSALAAVGGFPCETIFGEDTCVAARMILAGRKIAYCAESAVYHSHDYGILEEFRRYFDIGVLHSRESWLIGSLGRAEGEGLRFVLSEARYLAARKPLLLPSALVRTIAKYLGYKLGVKERNLLLRMKYHFSMNKEYWR